jgi:hypothetical protein
LGSVAKADGLYGLSKANIGIDGTKTFKGYGASVDVSVTAIGLDVVLFPERTEEPVPTPTPTPGPTVEPTPGPTTTPTPTPERVLGDPTIASPAAGIKVVTANGNKCLLVDIDPNLGMTLYELADKTSYAGFEDCSLHFEIAGNDGTALVKTSDRMTVSAWKNGVKVAEVQYIVIVMGDANCNGIVNSSDATAMCSIYFGATYSLEAMIAADVNFTGTFDAPRINSSDAAYISAKYFTWGRSYQSNLQ